MAGAALSRDATERSRLRRATLATSSSSHNSKRPEDECHGGRARPRPAFDAWPVNPARAFFIIQSRSNQGPKTRAQPPRRGDGRLLGHRRHTVAAPASAAAPAAAPIDRCHHHRRSRPSTTAARASSGPTLAVAHAVAPEPVAGKRARQVAPHSTRRAGTTRARRKDEKGCAWAASRRPPTR